MAVVYWIKLNDYTDITKQGYVGVSTAIENRLAEHHKKAHSSKHENIILQRHMQKHKDEIATEIVFEGTEHDCYKLEEDLRPDRHIGWNINRGGTKPPVNFGHTWNNGRKHSLEIRRARSENTKRLGIKPPGNQNTFWWNNGKESTMSSTCPGDGWIRGRLTIWWTNGTENVFKTKRPGPEWNPGRSTPWMKKD